MSTKRSPHLWSMICVLALTSMPCAFNLETRPSRCDSVMRTIAARPDLRATAIKRANFSRCIVGIELNFMKVRIFFSCGLRELIAFQGAADKLLTPKNRIHRGQQFALGACLQNVTQSARAQSFLHDVEVIVLTQEDNLGAGRKWSYVPGGFDSIQLGETDNSRIISGFRSWAF